MTVETPPAPPSVVVAQVVDDPGPKAPPTEAEIAVWLDTLATSRWPVTRNPALWKLEDCGRLPAEWADKVPPRPAPEPAESPARAQPPVATPAIAPLPTSTDPKTEDLIRKLANPGGPEAAEQLVHDIAVRFAAELNEWGSVAGFKPKLRLVVARKIPLKLAIGGYQSARVSKTESKGAAFHKHLNDGMEAIALKAARQARP